MKMEKTIIVYYSYTGNTKSVCDKIKQIIDCNVYSIVLTEKYSEVNKEFVLQVREHLKSKTGPEIEQSNIDFSKYDTVILATANWGNTMTPPMLSFLKNNVITGKNIYPLISHGGNGTANILKDLKTLTVNCNYAKELVIKGDECSLVEMKSWLNQ